MEPSKSVETGEPFLLTKLFVPPVRAVRVARPGLVTRLNQGLNRKLTLVSAPAGFGKTTLVAGWLQQAGRPFAWLSLDDGDDDPTRFLTYLGAALQRVNSSWGQLVQAALHVPQPPPPQAVVAALINEIATDGADFVLVLDDYHLVSARPVHDVLALLLDNMPPQMHLVLLTRADPPLPLARLRASGELAEIRADDLRFTTDEAAAFLGQVMQLDLTAGQIAALTARTEGWVVGLQLAALSLQSLGHDDVAAFIEAFAGSHRYVMDYLIEEVLSRQPPHIQAFLLATSILDRLSGRLCDALTGRSDGQETLEGLERSNLFTTPLDHERRWYRYHQLFADLLRDRLQQLQPDRVPALHRRAGQWFEGRGMIPDSVAHALAAGDHETVVRLIQEGGGDVLRRGEPITLLRWIERLPDELVRSQPRLCSIHAWALTLTGQVEAVEPRLQDVARGLADEARRAAWGERAVRTVLSESVAIRAYAAWLAGDAGRTVALAQEALEELLPENLTVRSVVAFVLGRAALLEGDTAGAQEAASQAIRMGQAAGNTHLVVPATCFLADLQAEAGQLHRADETYQEALRLAGEGSGRLLPVAAEAYLGLGRLQYEWDNLEAATRYLTESVELAKQWGNAGIMALSYAALALARQAQGDAPGAFDLWQRSDQVAREYTLPPLAKGQLAADRLSFWLARGSVADAARPVRARESGLSAEDEPGYLRESEQIALVRLLIAEGKMAGALRLSQRLSDAAQRAGRTGRLIKILVLQALAFQGSSDSGRAVAALGRALSLAEPEGYRRTFVDEGRPVAGLLRQVRSRGILPGYVGRLLAAFEGAERPQPPAGQPLIAPLTARELEILHLVAAGLRNREIADQLVISQATVKRHIYNIYGKLEVNHRTQAVARARELGLLLPPP